MERDQAWAAIASVADRLTSRYCADDTLVVFATRRRSGLRIVEGLSIEDNWTDVFEPIRRRRMFGKRWTEIQTVQEAAANVGAFLRERPDLADAQERSKRRLLRWHGECRACGHDWREHKPNIDTDACSECMYEVQHGQRETEAAPCEATAPPPPSS